MPLIEQYIETHPHEINDAVNSTDAITALSNNFNAELIKNQQPRTAPILALYPLQSTSLKPGKVESRAINVRLPQPIYIVGDDRESRDWLHSNVQILIKLHAKGFVVNIESETEMNKLQHEFPELVLVALPGNALAEWLKLSNYPVLISNKLIEQ